MLKSTVNAFPIHKKYTLQSVGIWERLRCLFAVDSNRSTGVPLNPQYRNPPPGALLSLPYDDPVTLPSGDIADNPYWRRDSRRNYPRPSLVGQADIVELLKVGSKAAPKDNSLQAGKMGVEQLGVVHQEYKTRDLGVFLGQDKKNALGILDRNNMPPQPCSVNTASTYQLGSGEGYPATYPCRTFL